MFTITPRGYYFRKQMHRRVDGIVNAFKQAPQRPDGAALDAGDAEALGYNPPAAYAAQSRRVRLLLPPVVSLHLLDLRTCCFGCTRLLGGAFSVHESY